MSQPQGPPQARAEPESPRVSEQLEQRAQEEQRVADNTAQKVTSTDLLGREVKEDIIGVDDNDEHKEGLRGIAEGLLAPTSQIAQMPKDIVQGVATEDQRMQTSWIDLLITPLLAPVMAAPQLGLTSRSYYNPLALAPRDAEWAQSLPEFLKQSEEPETRDFFTGMGDNVTALYEASTSSEVARLRDEGDVDKGITGWKQSGEEFMKYPGYYLASAVGELPYMVTPMASVRVSTKVMATVIRITNKPGLKPSFLSATSRLDIATTKLKKVIQADKKSTAIEFQNAADGRTKIKDVPMKTVDKAHREFEHFTKTEIKTRESTIKQLQKEKKNIEKGKLSKEEQEFIDKSIFDEQSKITQREAELTVVSNNLKKNKETLKNAKDEFNKIETPTKESNSKEVGKYTKARMTYLEAKSAFMKATDNVVTQRFDFTKKRSYEKIKSAYNAYRSQEKAKAELKIVKLKKQRDGYTMRKFGLNEFQKSQIKKLESKVKLDDSRKPVLGPTLKGSDEITEDLKMAEFIKSQKTMTDTKFIPGELGDDVVSSVSKVELKPDDFMGPRQADAGNVFIDNYRMAPTGKVVTKETGAIYVPRKFTSKLDTKIGKLERKIQELENDKIPLYEKVAVGLEELPYKSVLPVKTAVAGKIAEQETKKVYDVDTNTWTDAPLTTADKIASIVGVPKDALTKIYVRKEQRIADKVKDHLRLPNRIYVQDTADPSKGALVLDMSKSDFVKHQEKISGIDIRISNAKTLDEATSLRQQKVILERELQQTAKTVDTVRSYVPEKVYTKDGVSYNVVDPKDAFLGDKMPELAVVDTVEPVVRVTQGANKGEWNVMLAYSDDVVNMSDGKIPPLDISGTVQMRTRVDVASDLGPKSVVNLKGSTDFFSFTLPEDRVLGTGMVFRGKQQTRSGPVAMIRGDDLSVELIKDLALEPRPMETTMGQETVFSFAGLSKKNFRKLFRKGKKPVKVPKTFEDKTVYMMIDPAKFGNRVDNAWQRYAESSMTDVEAGSMRIRYEKDGLSINTTVADLYKRRMLYEARGEETFQKKLLSLSSSERDTSDTIKQLLESKKTKTNELNAMNKPFQNKIQLLKDSIQSREESIRVIKNDLKEGKEVIVIRKKAVPVEVYPEMTPEHKLLSETEELTSGQQARLTNLDRIRESKKETVWRYEKELGFDEQEQYLKQYGAELPTGRINPNLVQKLRDEKGDLPPLDEFLAKLSGRTTKEGSGGIWRSQKARPDLDIIGPQLPSSALTKRTPKDIESSMTEYLLTRDKVIPGKDAGQSLTKKQAEKLISTEEKNITEAKELLSAMEDYGIHSSMAYQGDKYKGNTAAAYRKFDIEKQDRKRRKADLLARVEVLKGKIAEKELQDAGTGEVPLNKQMEIAGLKNDIDAVEAGINADRDTVMRGLLTQDNKMQRARENNKISQSEYDLWNSVYSEMWESYDNPNYIQNASLDVLEDFSGKITKQQGILQKQAENPGRHGNFDEEFELQYFRLLNTFEDVIDSEIVVRRNRINAGDSAAKARGEEIGSIDDPNLDVSLMKQEAKELKKLANETGNMYNTVEQRRLNKAVSLDKRLWKNTTDDNDYQNFLHTIETKKKEIADIDSTLDRRTHDLNMFSDAKKKVTLAQDEWEGFREKYKDIRGFSPGIPRGRVIEFTGDALDKEGLSLTDSKGKPIFDRELFMRLPDGQVITRGSIITQKGQDKIDVIVEKSNERARGYESQYGIDILNVRSGLSWDEANAISKIRKDNTIDTVFVFKNEDDMVNQRGGVLLTKEAADKIEFGDKTESIMSLIKSDKEYPMEYGLSSVGKIKLKTTRKVKNDRETASQLFGMIKKSYDERVSKLPRGIEIEGTEVKVKRKPVAVSVYPDEGVNYSIVGGSHSTRFQFDNASQSWVSIEFGKAFGNIPGKLTRQRISSSWDQKKNMELSRMLSDSDEIDIMGEIRAGSRTFTIYEHSPPIQNVDRGLEAQAKMTPSSVPEELTGKELYVYLTTNMNAFEKSQFDRHVRSMFVEFVVKDKDGKTLTKQQKSSLPNVRDVEVDIIERIDSDIFRSSTKGERARYRSKTNKAVFDTDKGQYASIFPSSMNIQIAKKEKIIDARTIYMAVKGIDDIKERNMIRDAMTKVSQKLGRGKPQVGATVVDDIYEEGYDNALSQNIKLEAIRDALDKGKIPGGIKEVQKSYPELVRQGEGGLVLRGTIEIRPEQVAILKAELDSPAVLTLDNISPDELKNVKIRMDKVEDELLDKKVTQYLDDYERGKRVSKPKPGAYEGGADMNKKQRGYDEILVQMNRERHGNWVTQKIGNRYIRVFIPDVNYTMSDLKRSVKRLKRDGIVKEVPAYEAYERDIRPVKIFYGSNSKLSKIQKKIDSYDAQLKTNPSSKMKKHLENLKTKKINELENEKNTISSEHFEVQGEYDITWERNTNDNTWVITKKRKEQVSKDFVNIQKTGDERPYIPYDEEWQGYNESWGRPGSDQIKNSPRRTFEISQLEREHARLKSFIEGDGSLAGRTGTDSTLYKDSSVRPFEQKHGMLTKKASVWRGDERYEIDVNMVETESGLKIDYSSLEDADKSLGIMIRKREGLDVEPSAMNAIEFEDELIRSVMPSDPAVGPSGPMPKWKEGRVEDSMFKSTYNRPRPRGASKIYQDAQLELNIKLGIGDDVTKLTATNKMRKIQNMLDASESIPKLESKLDSTRMKIKNTTDTKIKSTLQQQLVEDAKTLSQTKTRVTDLEKSIAKDYSANVEARRAAIKTIDQSQVKRKDIDPTPGTIQAYGIPSTNILQSAFAEEQKQKIPQGIPFKPSQPVIPSTLAGITKGLESMTQPAQGSILSPQLNAMLSAKSGWREGVWEKTMQEQNMAQTVQTEIAKMYDKTTTMVLSKAALRDRVREDEMALIAPVSQEFIRSRQRNYQNIPPIAPQLPMTRQIPITPGFIGPYWEDPQDRFLRTKRKKTKSKKIYWEVPEYWFQPGYWGGKDQMGPGYRVFKGKEPKRIRKKDKRKNLD